MKARVQEGYESGQWMEDELGGGGGGGVGRLRVW